MFIFPSLLPSHPEGWWLYLCHLVSPWRACWRSLAPAEPGPALWEHHAWQGRLVVVLGALGSRVPKGSCLFPAACAVMSSLQKEECVIKCFLPPQSEDVGHPTPLHPAEAWEPFGEVLPPEIGVCPPSGSVSFCQRMKKGNSSVDRSPCPVNRDSEPPAPRDPLAIASVAI